MSPSLAIGDFARATQLSVKTLRHYHRVGLLVPAAVDAQTGYRHYTTDQIPAAQVIRRFRDLDMPLDDIAAVLRAPDVETRNDRIAVHLRRLEGQLGRTQTAVASLRDLLDHPTPATIGRRTVAPITAAAVRETLSLADLGPWFQGAIGELYATLRTQGVEPAGPIGGIFATELLAEEHGEAMIFVPCAEVRPVGRILPLTVPGVELATIVHAGPHEGIDRAYGALATYVAQHALAVEGPIWEYYLVGLQDTTDQSRWRTEIGWPVFATG